MGAWAPQPVNLHGPFWRSQPPKGEAASASMNIQRAGLAGASNRPHPLRLGGAQTTCAKRLV